jgi:hypothetical protein
MMYPVIWKPDKPEKKRVYCLAVTSEDNRDQGRPSSWSSVDKIIFGATGISADKKLLLVSVGNVHMMSHPNTPLKILPNMSTTPRNHSTQLQLAESPTKTGSS